MAGWTSIFQQRTTTPEEAVRSIQPGQRCFLTGNCSVPQKVMKALVDYAPNLHDVEIVQVLTVGNADYVKPGMEEHLRVNTLFISDNVRLAVNEGRADFTPMFLSEIPKAFKTVLPVDVALIQVSPPDDHGYCSFGVEVGVTKAAAQAAKIVIAEVNQQMPRTLGDSFIHVSKITHTIPVDYRLPEMQMGSTSEIAVQIAKHIAALIPDGATLQTGIGAIPDAVLKQLGGHRRPGRAHRVVRRRRDRSGGARRDQRRAQDRSITARSWPGSCWARSAYTDFADDNPIIELHPTEYVNDPFVIAQNDRMVAINSAIEIDLTGQVCADSIGPRLYSGVGGQVDFIYGASRSEGGIPIIALPSSALIKGQNTSKIVPLLKHGAGVVTTRNHVRFIVTEYGVADLYGKNIRQRARALINIAHPEFRDELERQAKELKYL